MPLRNADSGGCVTTGPGCSHPPPAPDPANWDHRGTYDSRQERVGRSSSGRSAATALWYWVGGCCQRPASCHSHWQPQAAGAHLPASDGSIEPAAAVAAAEQEADAAAETRGTPEPAARDCQQQQQPELELEQGQPTVIVHPPPSSRPSWGPPDAAGTQQARRAAFHSRTLGSLTAWQMLAAEVQQELEAGAALAGTDGTQPSQASSSSSAQTPSSASSGAAHTSGSGKGASKGSQAQQAQHAAMQQESSTLELDDVMPEQQGLGGSGSSTLPGSSAGSAGIPRLGSTTTSSGGGDSSAGFEQRYVAEGQLGAGAFGRALLARRGSDGRLVCVKVLDCRAMSRMERRMTRGEVRVLRALCHPNIVAYHECFFEAGRQYIAMEYCEEGDLQRYIDGQGGVLLGEEDIMLRFVQIALALQHVHAKGIIHRDIKASNLFCSLGGILKLGDFGVSKALAAGAGCARTVVGTPYYMSPELMEDQPYDSKTDVWAAGCVLYELCTLHRPFEGRSVSSIAVKIMRGAYAPLPAHYSPPLHHLLGAMLSRRPERRPSFEQILAMPYVRHHMRGYRQHLQRCVEARRASYQASLHAFQLDAFHLDAAAEMGAAAPPAQADEAAAAEAAVEAAAAGTGAAAGAAAAEVAAIAPTGPARQSMFCAAQHVQREALAAALFAPEPPAGAGGLLTAATAGRGALGWSPGGPEQAAELEAMHAAREWRHQQQHLHQQQAESHGDEAADIPQQPLQRGPLPLLPSTPAKQLQWGLSSSGGCGSGLASPQSHFAATGASSSATVTTSDPADSIVSTSHILLPASPGGAAADGNGGGSSGAGSFGPWVATGAAAALLRQLPELLQQVQALLQQPQQPDTPGLGSNSSDPCSTTAGLGGVGEAAAAAALAMEDMEREQRERRAAAQACVEELLCRVAQLECTVEVPPSWMT